MFTLEQIAAAVSGRVVGPLAASVCGVSTDSRTVAAGELFVPLVGERFDGHDFIPSLQENGVKVCLANEGWLAAHQPPDGLTVVAVADTLKGLGDLALAYRMRFNIPVIGVTGSNGKTTTKEMLATVLEQTGPGLKTEGNLNNLIGLPRMVFRLLPEHRWAVLEMGMSEPGEIDRLAEIAKPQVGVVLNAFPAHLASMGSVEAVAKAKGEMLFRVSDHGVAVVNADDPKVSGLPQNPSAGRVSFGINRGEVRAQDIRNLGIKGQQFMLITPHGNAEVTLAAFGTHNIYNALATAAALQELLPVDAIADGLGRFTPYAGRFRLEQVGGLTLIDDSYNANPASMGAALATAAELKGEGRLFVALGDMLELGGDEAEMHRMLGVQAAQVADRLYLVGELTAHTAEGAVSAGMQADAVVRNNAHAAIADEINKLARPGDLVLVKGSRGMKMEQVALALRKFNESNRGA